MDLGRMRVVARSAALAGAAVVRVGRPPAEGEAKGLPGDWVTEVDVAAEVAIEGLLRAETPDIPVQGEESGGVATGLRWVVDPLDGTTNFLHGFWAVGVSVALVEEETPVAAAIVAPFLGDVWHAARGGGAVWEPPDGPERPARVSDRPVERAVVGTGFPFRAKDRLPRYLATFQGALERFEDLRRPGAACLDLAWVACGIFEGFFELGLAPWDVAGGGLLIEEAGGAVTDWEGTAGYVRGDILAGPHAVHAELLELARGG
jgi:myo-inositol-1(or 4)-monophosphatase